MPDMGMILQVMNISPTSTTIYKRKKLGMATPSYAMMLLGIDDNLGHIIVRFQQMSSILI